MLRLYRCEGQKELKSVVNLDDHVDDTAIIEEGTITFDVPSEADEYVLRCLPFVARREDCFGVGLQHANTHAISEDQEGVMVETFRRIGLVRLTLKEGTWFDLQELSEPTQLRLI